MRRDAPGIAAAVWPLLVRDRSRTHWIERSIAAAARAVPAPASPLPRRIGPYRLVREIGPLSPSVPDFPLATAALAALMTDSARRGTSDFVPLWCGQNASGCKEIPAAELTRELAAAIR